MEKLRKFWDLLISKVREKDLAEAELRRAHKEAVFWKQECESPAD